MKTKLVTAYYPLHQGPPFWGKQNRERWYKHSIASICETKVPIICYTDELGYDELFAVKTDRQLDNLTIKMYDLTTSQFHDRVYKARMEGNPEMYNNELHPYYRMPVSVYWMKWGFLKMEYEEDTYIYWIDGGLSTQGVFPGRASSYGTDPGYFKNYNGEEGDFYTTHEFKLFVFDKIFNLNFIPNLNKFSEGKIVNICRQDCTDNDFHLFEEKLNLPKGNIIYTNKFPVGALFGGHSSQIMKYVDEFNEVANKVLEVGDYVCTEQEIMGYVHSIHPDWFTDWTFHDFYHEDWKLANGPSVLIPYREAYPNNISFSKLFIDTLGAPQV
jgi:hypothetical protein